MKLKDHEIIRTAWCERCHGPGWSNQPCWVLIEDRRDGKLRVECLQPDEQPPLVVKTFELYAVVHGMLMDDLRRAMK